MLYLLRDSARLSQMTARFDALFGAHSARGSVSFTVNHVAHRFRFHLRATTMGRLSADNENSTMNTKRCGTVQHRRVNVPPDAGRWPVRTYSPTTRFLNTQ